MVNQRVRRTVSLTNKFYELDKSAELYDSFELYIKAAGIIVNSYTDHFLRSDFDHQVDVSDTRVVEDVFKVVEMLLYEYNKNQKETTTTFKPPLHQSAAVFIAAVNIVVAKRGHPYD